MDNGVSLCVQKWSAWAPGLELVSDWRSWLSGPTPLQSQVAPKVPLLDATQRRRASQLTKISLEVAQRCVAAEQLGAIRTVFASRHGECRTSQALLETLGREEMLSPMAFSVSVHNTTAGVLSIAAKNRAAASAVAGGRATLLAGLIEAAGVALHEPVLLIVGEELVPEVLQEAVGELPFPFALAILFARQGTTALPSLTLSRESCGFRGGAEEMQSISFLRFLFSDGESCRLSDGRSTYLLTKHGGQTVDLFAAGGEASG